MRRQRIEIPEGFRVDGERLCADLGIPSRCLSGGSETDADGNEVRLLFLELEDDAPDVVLDQDKHRASPPARPGVSAPVVARLDLGVATQLEQQRALAAVVRALGLARP